MYLPANVLDALLMPIEDVVEILRSPIHLTSIETSTLKILLGRNGLGEALEPHIPKGVSVWEDEADDVIKLASEVGYTLILMDALGTSHCPIKAYRRT